MDNNAEAQRVIPAGLPGATRTVISDRYAVLTPESFTAGFLSGWEKATCNIVISPGVGARFTQALVSLGSEGECAGNTGASEYFIYLLAGSAGLILDDRRHRLEVGSIAYVPPDKDVQIKSAAPNARLLLYHRQYIPLPRVPKPAALVTHEREAKVQTMPGNEGIRILNLLPDEPMFDLSARTVIFPPGAFTPSAASFSVERAVFVLRGQGIVRLGGEWHPVQGGDALWVAAHLPQWFAALGKEPTSLLQIQEVNREI